VVITSYEMFTAEQGFFRNRIVWSYVILDEGKHAITKSTHAAGHRIKNHETILAQHMHGIRSQFRLILTGTYVLIIVHFKS
jgi:SWI/SNF-related matrix-associated actin-dependent regulator of chromatin subfamily A member 5